LYLANQAKALAQSSSVRVQQQHKLRSGETMFAIPVHLKVSSKSNVRECRGNDFPVAFFAPTPALPSRDFLLDEWSTSWQR